MSPAVPFGTWVFAGIGRDSLGCDSSGHTPCPVNNTDPLHIKHYIIRNCVYSTIKYGTYAEFPYFVVLHAIPHKLRITNKYGTYANVFIHECLLGKCPHLRACRQGAEDDARAALNIDPEACA